MAVTNPFLLAYRGIWTVLEANSSLIGTSALVQPGNCVKMFFQQGEDGSDYVRDPKKDAVRYADSPELEVEPVGGYSHMYRTSSGTSVTKRYNIWIRTGEQQTGQMMLVEWEVLRAMMDWKTTLEALKWNSTAFVKDCRLVQQKEQLTPDRTAKGWVMAWSGLLDMWFTSTALPPS